MTFVVTFQADTTSDAPPHVQLRGVLKDALRRHGMRCVDIAEHHDDCDKTPIFTARGQREKNRAPTVAAFR